MKQLISQFEPLESRWMLAANRFFYFGNSMTNGLDFGGLADLVNSTGTNVTWGRQSKGGSSTAINYFLDPTYSTSGFDPARSNNPDPWGNWTNAFKSTWDAIVFQPHERLFKSDLKTVNGVVREEGEIPSVVRFMEQIAVKSPGAQVYVYSRPAFQSTATADYSVSWNKTYTLTGAASYDARYSRSAITQLIPLIRQAQLADSITHNMPLVNVIPAGETYYNIDQMIKAGKFAGTPVTSMRNFYVDYEHPTPNLGAYALALTYSSVLTGNDPRGQIIPNVYLPETGPLSNQTVVSLIQQAVYDAIHDPAYSNITTAMPGDAPKPGAISVHTFNDMNNNGIADIGETNLGSMLVYLDKNNNSIRDPEDQYAITDVNGNGYFPTVPPGNYVFRSVTPRGYQQFKNFSNVAISSFRNTDAAIGFTETPAAIATASLKVRVFTSAIANGAIRESDTPISGSSVYLDLANNGVQDPIDPVQFTDQTGTARFDNLLAGKYTLRVVGATQMGAITLIAGTVSEWKVGLYGYVPAASGVIQTNLFQDINRNGLRDATETSLPNVTVFLDQDNDGRRSPLEVSVVTDATGVANFVNLPAGSYRVRAIAPVGCYIGGVGVDNLLVLNATQSNVAIGISLIPAGLAPGAIRSGKSSISGTVVDDKNIDGYWTSGELGIAGRTVWIDGNNNGLLDVGEPTAITNNLGKYTFINLAGGIYYLRQVLPVGAVQTFPLFNKSFKVTVAANAFKAGGDFKVGVPIIAPPPPPDSASISGLLFYDTNKNGLFEKGDSLQSGKVVYIDTNGNGILDTTETRTTTSEAGVFTFTGLLPGVYKIRRVIPTGYKVITPPADITVFASQVVTGVLIGTAFI